jgi:class 3 adenylate cyclase
MGFAQGQKTADSLLRVLETTRTTDAQKLAYLVDIAVYAKDGQQKIKYGKQGSILAEKLNDIVMCIRAYRSIANGHELLANFDSALFYNFKALEYSLSVNQSTQLQPIYDAIASLYMSLNNYAESADYYKKSLESARIYSDPKLDTASTYNNLGELYNYQGKFDSALYYYNVSLKDYIRTARKRGQAYVIGNIGTVYAQTGKHEQAKANIDSAVHILLELQDMYPIAVYLTYMADIYEQAGNPDRAVKYLEESLSISQQYKLKEQIRDAHKALATFYQKRNRYDSAYRHQSLYFLYKDSVQNVDNVKRIAEMRADYEVSQKQTEVDLLHETGKAQRLVAILLGVGVVFAVVSALFLYRRSRERRLTNQQLTLQKEEIEQERQKAEMLLLNILPVATAKELKEKGAAVPRHYEMVSILFTDFKGFTQLAEKITPAEVVEELNYCYKAFDDICLQYGIEKIKTIGDAYMAAGGIPVANKTNPIDVIKCALAMQAFMQEWKANKQAQGLPVWELRLGIHTGEVIAGVVGKNKFAYDIWGDAVNIASRMESSGEPGFINVSDTTYELAKEHFEFEYRGKVHAKNKGDIDMYFVKS